MAHPLNMNQKLNTAYLKRINVLVING